MTTQRVGGSRGALPRYVGAATLARAADGGGVVAIVLLVTTSGGPGWLAGLLAACLTFPHLLGPFIARWLDVAQDARTVLTVACLAHGGALAAAVLVYPHAVAVTAALLVLTGLSGPLLTGGISSQLPRIAGENRVAQRRAHGWDVATYGIGGTIGPTVVAAVAAWSTPSLAALVLAAGTLVAALVVRRLPCTAPPACVEDVPRPIRTLRIITSSGPLRRTLYLTMLVALSVAVIPITAVASTASLGVAPAAAGLLTALYGLGNLLGSAVVMTRPLRGDADRAMPLIALTVALALVGVAVARTLWGAGTAYVLTGALNAVFFAATLAGRSEYAPAAARGQVFVWVGATKIAAGSVGAAAAGVAIAHAPHLPAFLAAIVTTAGVGVATFDRRRSEPHNV